MNAAEQLAISAGENPAQCQSEADEIPQEHDRCSIEMRQQKLCARVEKREHGEGGDHQENAAHLLLLRLAAHLGNPFAIDFFDIAVVCSTASTEGSHALCSTKVGRRSGGARSRNMAHGREGGSSPRRSGGPEARLRRGTHACRYGGDVW